MSVPFTNILDRIMASGASSKAISAGVGAALGAVVGPVASTITGDDKSDKETLTRDMIAGALGGALGGLIGPAGGAVGGAAGGMLAGLFDREKKSSDAGQDLRLPVMGGTKFPTHDSVSAAARKLNQSSAEVGPQPATTYSGMGKMKKVKVAWIGDPMDPMMDDPLVQYLKKTAAQNTAEEQPPLTNLVDGSELKDNLSDMPTGKEEHELTSQPPCPTVQMKEKGLSKTCVNELFDNQHAARKKFTDKDHPFEGFDQGVVDRILGL